MAAFGINLFFFCKEFNCIKSLINFIYLCLFISCFVNHLESFSFIELALAAICFWISKMCFNGLECRAVMYFDLNINLKIVKEVLLQIDWNIFYMFLKLPFKNRLINEKTYIISVFYLFVCTIIKKTAPLHIILSPNWSREMGGVHFDQ